jgi:hypothetical protein
MNIDRREETIRPLLPHLAGRGIAREWAARQQPLTDLCAECRAIVSDQEWRQTIRAYLRSRPIIQDSVETVLAQLAMAAGTSWQTVAEILRPLARRGWHIGRWLPTFLLVDGPLARFLRDGSSPLNLVLRREARRFPLLEQARDAFNNDLFRLVRNGFGHWSFVWQEEPGGSCIRILHWESGQETAKLTLLEAEALHIFTFSVIEILDSEFFKPCSGGA